MFCREHAVQLHRAKDRFEAAGAELVLVGNGKGHWVDGFRKDTGFDGKILVDPELVTYKMAELKRSMASVFNPLVIPRGLRALVRGNMQHRTQGDPGQQGGVLVIDRAGAILYAHRSGSPGDNASPAQILAGMTPAA